jgi:hypothetical protein
MVNDEKTASREMPQQAAVDLVEDIDMSKDAAANAAIRGQAATGYETLTLWETVKTFKVSTAACFLAAFSAATDGYQIG